MDEQRILSKVKESALSLPLQPDWAILHISGTDAATFLHNITTNEIYALPDGFGNRQALLNKKSQVLVLFYCYRRKNDFYAICEKGHLPTLMEELEHYHFSEDVTFSPLEAKGLQIHGRTAHQTVAAITGTEQESLLGYMPVFETRQGLCFSLPITGEPGYLLTGISGGDVEGIESLTPGTAWHDALSRLAVDAGHLRQNTDFGNGTMVMELDLGPLLVSISKGCFPGQEVVAKIVSRGKTPRKLAALAVPEEASDIEAGAQLTADGKKAGVVQRTYRSPALDRTVALAFIKSDLADAQDSLTVEVSGNELAVEIRRLPLFISPAFAAERDRLYNKGMSAYHQNGFTEAEQCFRQALALDNHHADSWEALAMSVEKRGDIDEAIRLNMRYAEADPLAVMAHTNMSRLYMLKGFKDKAEEQQGKAALVEFKLQARQGGDVEQARRELEEKQKANAQAEMERKAGIFKQVLEMDPEDEIANFGMGKLLLESDQAARALVHLRRVVDNNPDYSMAWQLLGQAMIKTGELEEARITLERGLEAAERQGDMMPAKAIKQMLSLL